ncbi:DUF7673 family protein [Ralstonia thomasii]|jgi:hypothetical protein|nr:hypothetical protein [Ralstonia sp. LMG 18095]
MNTSDSGFVEVKSKVAKPELQAFMEHLSAFHEGDTDAQRAAEIRAQDENDGLDSLKRLFDLANGSSGQCRHVARFLLGLYNGTRFPFDLTDFRCVDASIFEDMMRVLRMDSRPRAEVHTYFPRGGERFEQLAQDWNLYKTEWEPAGSGFTRRRSAYRLDIEAGVRGETLVWKWSVSRWGGDSKKVASGAAWSAESAKYEIDAWFERGGETPYED